ncbi:MAG TPA: oxygenase MpaB family protein [Solirubrobacteraceae bacterium]|nr:oxygenase MpaB family protein [Solirubrobacteraceae bacterium]
MSQDAGLFGPGSVTWRVHSHPAMLIGGLRALMLQALHPHALAGVVQHSDFRERPMHRLRQTATYVATTTFGTTEQARAAGEHVRRVHTHVNGIDPVTGARYSAEDVDTLLWVHCVEVHSVLVAVRGYGVKLSDADQDAYLGESARVAELVGIPPDRVPASRADMREYFAAMLPHLCVSWEAKQTIDFVASPPLTRELLPYAAPLKVVASAAVGLMPRHLRRLAGIDRMWVADAATFASVGAAVRVLAAGMRIPFAEQVGERAMQQLVGGAGFRRAA